MNVNLSAVLSFLVAFQLFFVALYLFTHQKGNKRNNSLLGLVFLMFAISLLDFTIRKSGVVLAFPMLHLFDDGFFLLYGPMLYFYVQGVVWGDFKFKTRDVLHVIAYMVYTSFLTYYLIFTDLGAQTVLAKKVETGDLPDLVYLVTALEKAVRPFDPVNQVLTVAHVSVVGDRWRILTGLGKPDSIMTFGPIGGTTARDLKLGDVEGNRG